MQAWHISFRYPSGHCVACCNTPEAIERRRITTKNWHTKNARKGRESARRFSRHKACPTGPTRIEPEYCECCGRPGPVQLDHNHKTQLFRGWLCLRCNSGIGYLGDTIEGVLLALAYLVENEYTDFVVEYLEER